LSRKTSIVADDPFANRSDPATPVASGPANKDWRRLLPISLLLAAIVLGYALGWHENLTLQGLEDNGAALKQHVADNPVLAPFAFIAFYVLAVAMSFPAVALLKVIGGFLFGWLAGAIYIIVAATLGGALLFLSVRTAFGGFLRDKAGIRAGRLAREFERDAFAYMLTMRLAPFIPFVVASIAPALFDARLRTYLAATAIGIVPGAICFAWVGQGLHEVLEDAGVAKRAVALSDLVTPEITIALLALTLVAVLATIVRKVWGQQAS
jgi:uncharacterized membrane protein YdjX (TVP38/TMEM64 family)